MAQPTNRRTIREDRKTSVIALRAAHDHDLQRILEREGVDARRAGGNIKTDIERLAPDQRRRLDSEIEKLEVKSGVSMTSYERAFEKSLLDTEPQKKKIEMKAAAKLEGQLEAAKQALAQGREERFEAIRTEIANDAKSVNKEYGAVLVEAQDRMNTELQKELPQLSFEERRQVAQASTDQAPVSKSIYDLHHAPEQVNAIERAHQRELEQAANRDRDRGNENTMAPNPGR